MDFSRLGGRADDYRSLRAYVSISDPGAKADISELFDHRFEVYSIDAYPPNHVFPDGMLKFALALPGDAPRN